ncbi:FAD-binding oxidoreductase [Endozoicomonas elysicola]|uniref:D-lactate dehydrogenase (cytochrome) n=1 Tax=Endozoicomonas elysicola TaxID=305900 RepID=A0A081K9V0_9GAMM|nr:FAD-linked oxidase C-terminal domain-containing protein [Endozoicomonas elysicola]KEI70926.1 lactate dehydrogenase [Endozoicomonas elysicola]
MSLNPKLLGLLRTQFGERITTVATICRQHAIDESWHSPSPPDAVCYPETTQEVSQLVKLAVQFNTPLIPYGAGTSLEGHIFAPEGGVTVDLSRMNQLLAINSEDLDCVIQPGIRRKGLNDQLRHEGLFFPVDPGADASLGGMVATRASGTNAVRYGTMKDNVLALTAVMADGAIVHTGTRARKSAAGYDLTRLLVGSEGTLGIITEITLKLYPIPDYQAAARVTFPSTSAAVESAIQVVQFGVPIARMELMDAQGIKAINEYSKMNLPLLPTLFFEFHGSKSAVSEQADQVRDIVQEHDGSDYLWAIKAEDRNQLWHARHTAHYAVIATGQGSRGWTTDVCVPVSKLVDCIVQTRQDLESSFMDAPIIGHVGDGNFHVIFSVDPDNERQIKEVKRLNERLVERALQMDGTCTGEHGIGLGKKEWLQQEAGTAIKLMEIIKGALDPKGVLNPGKIVNHNPS